MWRGLNLRKRIPAVVNLGYNPTVRDNDQIHMEGALTDLKDEYLRAEI
jgi:FAD synthase